MSSQRVAVAFVVGDLSREVVSSPRQGLTYPQSTSSTLKSDFVLRRGISHINQLQLVAGAAQVGPQGAAQLGAHGAAQLGAQLEPQQRERQQCSFGMWNLGMQSFGHFQRWQREPQQPLLQQLATGAQQVGAQGAAHVGAQGAAHVGAQAGAQAGAAQVGAQAGAQAGAAHVGAQAGAAQLGAHGAAQLGAAVQQLLQLLKWWNRPA